MVSISRHSSHLVVKRLVEGVNENGLYWCMVEILMNLSIFPVSVTRPSACLKMLPSLISSAFPLWKTGGRYACRRKICMQKEGMHAEGRYAVLSHRYLVCIEGY